MTSSSKTKLNYKISTDSSLLAFNLSKESSNFTNNQLILHALIGTLVKYGPSGKIEPYLAENWHISNNRKKWTFTMRPNLVCEDGTAITAKLFHDSLIASLKAYSKKSSAITFDYLVGWKEFIQSESNNIAGIKIVNDTIEFDFERYPDDFLELLRMPFFGLWLGDSKIVSSSAYRLKSFNEKEVTVELRQDWFSTSQDSYHEVQFSFIQSSSLEKEIPKNTIIQMPLNSDTNKKINGAYWVVKPPTISDSFVLSPYKGFFKNLANRQVFKNRIRSISTSSPFLYSSAISHLNQVNETNYEPSNNKDSLLFSLERINFSKEEIENIQRMITIALEGSGQTFKLIPRDLNDKDFLKAVQSNSYFDARIASVDSGAHPTYSVLKMMFCTKMGITFPGHEDEFCNLIENNLNAGKEIDQTFIDQFNKSIDEKAIVIPIAHHSAKVLASESIDPHYLAPTSTYLQFERLKQR